MSASSKSIVDSYSRPEQVALCQSIRDGQREAWELFITDQYSTIFNMANLYSQGNRYQEHDLADWFGYVYDRLCDGRRLGQFRGDSALRTYLFRRKTGVIFRLFLDWLRTRREMIPDENIAEHVVARDNPEEEAGRRMQLRQLQQEAEQLTPVRRIAFFVPDFSEALTETDYHYLAEINGSTAEQMQLRVARIVERSSTDDELARLLYPTSVEPDLSQQSPAQLQELARQLCPGKLAARQLQTDQLLPLITEALTKRRINRLHSARRYARSTFRKALGRS